MARILSVSYESSLLQTREKLLESKGHAVSSARNLSEALEYCTDGTRFDLFVLGHSIPHVDKEMLIKVFRASCAAPVLALRRHGEAPVRGADFEIQPDPRMLLESVATLLSGKGTSA